MQLIKYHAMGIETMLVTYIGRQHLIDAPRGQIDQSLLRIKNFDSFCQSRTHPHHVGGNIENNGCLLTIGGTAIHFGSLLTVTAGQQ